MLLILLNSMHNCIIHNLVCLLERLFCLLLVEYQQLIDDQRNHVRIELGPTPIPLFASDSAWTRVKPRVCCMLMSMYISRILYGSRPFRVLEFSCSAPFRPKRVVDHVLNRHHGGLVKKPCLLEKFESFAVLLCCCN